MPLVDWEIEEALAGGAIEIRNLRPDAIQPNSVDLHLGEYLTIPRLRMRLSHTDEWIRLGPGYCGSIALCSTPARRGIDLAKAQWFDEQFQGQPTLELMYWGNPLEYGGPSEWDTMSIPAGEKIVQLVIERTMVARRGYGHQERNSHYQGQLGTTPARF